MIILLSYIGKRSSVVLLIGLVLALLLPEVSRILRPALPFLVSLVLGLAIARLDILGVLGEFASLRKTCLLLSLVLVLMPMTCILLVTVWRLLGLDENSELLLVVFAAAPPLSSATSLSLLLGYNARITLQMTLLATLATPILGPLCFAIIDVPTNIELISMVLRIAGMIAGGFVVGVSLQAILGKQSIEHHPQAFNGAVALVMVLFLFPLFDGVVEYVMEEPLLSAAVLWLAIVLNIGGNLVVRFISRRFTDVDKANALGLMFGNRNISIYLALLPLNPLLSIFIAASQIPMYATPALFGRDKSSQN